MERRVTFFTLGLIRTLEISNLTYIIILLIEFLQVISILIDGQLFLQWDGSVFYYFRIVTSFISISGLLSSYPSAITGMLITVDVFLLLLAVGTGVAIQYGSEMLNTSQV